MAKQELKLFFDLHSPYSYLAFHLISVGFLGLDIDVRIYARGSNWVAIQLYRV
jgi:2-hydroxychromene-2-carboxylate isomerase